jgi:hypothetical protein
MTLEQLLHEKRDEIRRIATAHGAYNKCMGHSHGGYADAAH